MRQKFNPQQNLFTTMARNKIAKELQQMSLVLDATPKAVELAYLDLVRCARPTTGREGMTAEQVLRCAILKQYRQLTYEELAFHLEDSDSFRGFSRLEMGQYPSNSPGEYQGPAGGDLGSHSPGDHRLRQSREDRDRSQGQH